MNDKDGLSNDDRLRRITSLKSPIVLDNRLNVLWRQSMAIASFLRFHKLGDFSDAKETGYFNEAFTDPQNKINPEHHEFWGNGDIEPAQAVLLNFIENLYRTSEKFNERWKEYPQWYIKDVLKVKPLPMVGDKVWVAFENAGEEPLTVPKDTLFKVDREENTTYYYRLTEDTEVHNTQISEVFLLLINRADTEKKYNYKGPISAINISKLETENHRVTKISEYASEMGVRISSPILLLKEGTRMISVTFYTDNKNWNVDERVEERRPSSFDSIFDIGISTESGWHEVEDYAVHISDNELTVVFQLSDASPPTTSCNKETHNCISAYPSLNLCFNFNSLDYKNILAENFWLSKVKIEVDVKGVSNILVYNELGKIDNSKPFCPFGINTEKGTWFIIGNHETNIKKTKTLYLNFSWEQLPDNPLGLVGHYSEYQNYITNHSYEISTNYLSDFRWKPTRGTNRYSLFSSEKRKADTKLYDESRIGPIDVEKMPIISLSEEEYEYSLQSRNGFLNFTLVSPDMGFGETVYRRVFTEQIMKSARRKQKYPSIQPPLQPLLKRITIDYKAEETIELSTQKKGDGSIVEPIIPLGFTSLNRQIGRAAVPFIEDMEDRNLLMALSNIKGGSQLNLFFELSPKEHGDLQRSTLHNQLEKLKYVKLYIGNPHYWEKAPLSFVRKDETIALFVSGCIQIQLPPELSSKLYDSNGRLWLRISHDNTQGINFPEITSVFMNAAKLEMTLPSDPDDKEKIILNRSDGELSEEASIPGLGKTTRISSFYEGREKETPEKMLTRISEYAAHKGRAVTPDDYEKLILQAFPDIAKVKCLVNQNSNGQMATVYVIVLPKNITNTHNQNYPLTPPHLLFYIEKYVRGLASSFVKEINVLNPVYEEIIIRCKIRQKGYFSLKRKKLLKAFIDRHIAPWQDTGELPVFGHSVNLEMMHNAITKEFGTEISFSDFSAIRVEKHDNKLILHDFHYKKSETDYDDNIIYPSERHSIFVPAEEHILYAEDEPMPDYFGIHEMKIGKNFIIRKQP